MSVEFEDVSGQPRPIRDIEEALAAITKEVVTNHMGRFKDGTPVVLHYIVIVDALRELIALRKLIQAQRELREKNGIPKD